MTAASFSQFRSGLTAAAFALAGMGAGAVIRSVSSAPAGHSPAAAARPSGESPPGKTGHGGAATAAVLDAFARAGTPGQQLAAALRLAEHGTEEEISELLVQSYRFPAHSAGITATLALLKRWLSLEPERAVDYCRQYHADHLPKIIASWSATEPEKAEEFLRGLPVGSTRTEGWLELCRASAARDPEQTWDLLRRMPGQVTGDISGSLREVMAKLVAANPESALRHMAELPAAALKAARFALSQELMKTDPARAWEWISQQPNPAELMREALRAGLDTDPARALDLFAGASVRQREQAMNELGHSGSQRLKNPPALAAALAQNQSLPAGERSLLAERLLNGYGWRAPAEMTALLPLVSGDELSSGTARLLSQWTARDPAAAAAWVDSLPEGPIRQAALEARAARANTEPQSDRDTPEGFVEAFKKGRSFSDDNERIALLTPAQIGEVLSDTGNGNQYRMQRIWDTLAARNPVGAAQWLEAQVIDTKTGPKAARFAAQWANEDPAAAAAWVSTLSAGDLARTAAENVARQYQRHAPAQAAAWIQTLPAGPVRDAALAGAP